MLQCKCQLSLESESCSEETRFVGVATWHSVLQCVAVCCSVLQCNNQLRISLESETGSEGGGGDVAVCCSVLQCVAVCCSVLPYVAMRCSASQCAEVCCRVLHGVAAYCIMLQRVAACCSVLQRENV